VQCPKQCFNIKLEAREVEEECEICDGEGRVKDQETGLFILCPRAPTSRTKFGLTSSLSCYDGMVYVACNVCDDFKMVNCSFCLGRGKMMAWVYSDGRLAEAWVSVLLVHLTRNTDSRIGDTKAGVESWSVVDVGMIGFNNECFQYRHSTQI
jgi:RecJ-like exonuclease